MKALKFTVYGDYGYFKNHESNYRNMTYQYIHKPAIEGLLGAIVGLDGFRQMGQHNNKLEYDEVFKNSKIAIIPTDPHYDVFYEEVVNTTGFCNNGTNAIIRKQILQNPSYTIIILEENIDKEIYNKLTYMLTHNESVYRLCLGGNNYSAFIKDVSDIELQECLEKEELIINSIIPFKCIEEIYEESTEDEEPYRMDIYLPVKYDEKYGHEKEKVCYSNYYLDIKEDCNIYRYNKSLYYFI